MQKKKLLETITIWKAFITWSHNPATICNIQCWKAPIQDLFVMCIYIYIYILLSANSLSDIYEAGKHLMENLCGRDAYCSVNVKATHSTAVSLKIYKQVLYFSPYFGPLRFASCGTSPVEQPKKNVIFFVKLLSSFSMSLYAKHFEVFFSR